MAHQLASPICSGLPMQRRFFKGIWCLRACSSTCPAASLPSPIKEEPLAFDGFVQDGKMRLDAWLASQLPTHISRARVQNSIRSGLASVNGQSVDKVSFTVRNGDHVKCAIAALVPLKANPEDIALDIVFEDEHVLVVNKPAQMVTHPAPGNWSGTLVNALVHHCELPVPSERVSEETSEDDFEEGYFDDEVEDESLVQSGHSHFAKGVPLAVRPGIVHRLDKGTSGLLVIAKDEHAHEHLSKQFKDRTVKRSYLSLTCGAPRPEGQVDAAIGRDSHNRIRMAVIPSSATGKKARKAVSGYKVLEVLVNGASALVEWRLETGRTHQIRVHAQNLGHPLLGDDLYGGTEGATLAWLLPKVCSSAHGVVRKLVNQMERPYLHAATLGFIHPQSLKEMVFTCPPPHDFEELLLHLRGLEKNLRS